MTDAPKRRIGKRGTMADYVLLAGRSKYVTESPTVPAPAFMSEGMKPKRIQTQPEWCLQRGVLRFCKRAIDGPYEAACHDRGRARSAMEHIGEAARGLRHGWPDLEIVLPKGRTFRCELKAPGVSIDDKGEQFRLLKRLSELGHPATWANSVYGFAINALSLGVPLQGNWQYVAQHEDELVAADVRKQIARAEAKRSAAPAPYKQPSRAPTPSRTRRWAKIQKALA